MAVAHQTLAGRHVLVTGGAGYVGSRLVAALVGSGCEVTVIDKLMFGDESLAGCREEIKLLALDIRAVQPHDLSGVDTIIHLAALSNNPTAEFRPEANRHINLEATVQLGRMARSSGVRQFIFASTCSVYERPTGTEDLLNEDAPVAPKALYSWSKRQAELALLEMSDECFQPVILRKGTIYGESPRMRYDLVVNSFTCDAFTKGELTVDGGGRMWRPLLHVDDAVEGYLAVMRADAAVTRGRVFNLVGENARIIQMAEFVQRALADLAPEALTLKFRACSDTRSYRVAGDRIRDALDFSPRNDMNGAVRAMWSALGHPRDPANPVFYNIRWIEALIEMEDKLGHTGWKVL